MPISKTVLAYALKATHDPLAIKHFLAWTEKGVKPPVTLPDRKANVDLGDLMAAHAVSSRIPHPLLEGIWVDGMADYPLGIVLIDYLRADKETFLRRRPVFERCYNLHAIAGGRLPPNSLRLPRV